jgi:hypothetical protein
MYGSAAATSWLETSPQHKSLNQSHSSLEGTPARSSFPSPADASESAAISPGDGDKEDDEDGFLFRMYAM